MREILNLTQHVATADQVAAGVIDPDPADAEKIRALLTFDVLPSQNEVLDRARALAAIAKAQGVGAAMIGGAPWLMHDLQHALNDQDIEPAYAFSVRESAEVARPDGCVEKRQVFRHVGFVRTWRHSRIVN